MLQDCFLSKNFLNLFKSFVVLVLPLKVNMGLESVAKSGMKSLNEASVPFSRCTPALSVGTGWLTMALTLSGSGLTLS